MANVHVVDVWLETNGGPTLRLRANLQWPNVGCQLRPNSKNMVGPPLVHTEFVFWVMGAGGICPRAPAEGGAKRGVVIFCDVKSVSSVELEAGVDGH